MSEYQYYEFQAIDRPLTVEEQAEIQKLSSRVRLTPNQAIFLYNYGDFRGEPKDLVAQYFDVMFYIANWGTWQFIFRLPKALVAPEWFQPYRLPSVITLFDTPQYIILDITINDEESIQGWIEGEGWLPRLLPLRDDLLHGDPSLLYLVWLRMADQLADYRYLEEDPVEPPIPPNLSKLSQPLKVFIELVELDPDLVDAAAQASPRLQSASELPLENWLSELSETERYEFLLKLVRRDPHVDLQLINRLKELAGAARSAPESIPGQRRFSELAAIAESIRTERNQKEKAAAKKKRIQELEALASKEAQTWERVVDLIQLKQARPYDEATALLKDLRDLAKYQGRLRDFVKRFEQLKSEYQNRPALIKRFRTIEL